MSSLPTAIAVYFIVEAYVIYIFATLYSFYTKKNIHLPSCSYALAGVTKLADVPDLGSGAARHGGSSPSTRTVVFIKLLCLGGLYFL